MSKIEGPAECISIYKVNATMKQMKKAVWDGSWNSANNKWFWYL